MDKRTGFAHKFYASVAWENCRAAYRRYRGGMCERCAARGLIVPGTQVHHKTRLTPNNINDPRITLSFENLELLCDDCHAAEHAERERTKRRWRVDKSGSVLEK